MTPTRLNMCEQLGRYLASADGVTFVEPDARVPSSSADLVVIAGPAPQAPRPARVVTIRPGVTPRVLDADQREMLTCEIDATAATERLAFTALDAIRTLLWPGGWHWVPPAVTVQGQAVVGAIGLPPAAATLATGATLEVWRVMLLSEALPPQLIAGRGFDQHTSAGEVLARMQIEMSAVPVTVTGD